MDRGTENRTALYVNADPRLHACCPLRRSDILRRLNCVVQHHAILSNLQRQLVGALENIRRA